VVASDEEAKEALELWPSLAELNQRSLAARLLALREALPPRVDVAALVRSAPGYVPRRRPGLLSPVPRFSLLCTEEVEASSPTLGDEVFSSRLAGCLSELDFLPPPLLAFVLADEPGLLVSVGLQRAGELRAAYEASGLPSLSARELEKEACNPRFEQYVRNALLEGRVRPGGYT